VSGLARISIEGPKVKENIIFEGVNRMIDKKLELKEFSNYFERRSTKVTIK